MEFKDYMYATNSDYENLGYFMCSIVIFTPAYTWKVFIQIFQHQFLVA